MFSEFFSNGWEFFIIILQAHCKFISTLNYKILFSYQWIFTFYWNFNFLIYLLMLHPFRANDATALSSSQQTCLLVFGRPLQVTVRPTLRDLRGRGKIVWHTVQRSACDCEHEAPKRWLYMLAGFTRVTVVPESIGRSQYTSIMSASLPDSVD